MKPCKLNIGFCSGQLDCVQPSGESVRMCQETAPCPFREHDSDLDTMKAIFARAGVHARAWQVNEYTRGDTTVRSPAIVLIHGSENDGPYTEYLFNVDGSLMHHGASSFYVRGNVMEQA